MTVKSLSEETKEAMASDYCFGPYSINELADRYNTSRKTVTRTLVEAGCYEVTPRKPKPVPARIPTKTPWWRRWFNSFAIASQRRFLA